MLLPNLYSLIDLGANAFAKQSRVLLEQLAHLRAQTMAGTLHGSTVDDLEQNDVQVRTDLPVCQMPPDEEVADLVEREVLRHGGVLKCNLLYVYNKQLRRLIGDQKLLGFLRQFPEKFMLRSEHGCDIVVTVRMSAVPDESTLGQTLKSANLSQEGRRAMRELEAAVIQLLQSWIPKTEEHDGPFLPRVARDSRVSRKLRGFVGHCPVAAILKQQFSCKRQLASCLRPEPEPASPPQQDELHRGLHLYGSVAASSSAEGSLSSSEAAWITQLLHLRLFLLDRPETFQVVDSGKACTKLLPNCCCHLKVRLIDGSKAELKSPQQKACAKLRPEAKKAAVAATQDLAAIQTLFANDEVLIVEKPHQVATASILKFYQKLADEEGRARQVAVCSSDNTSESAQDRNVLAVHQSCLQDNQRLQSFSLWLHDPGVAQLHHALASKAGGGLPEPVGHGSRQP